MEFGKRLEIALGLAEMDHKEFAAALGVSHQAVYQVLKGDTKALTAANTAKAARILDVDWYWLATGEGVARRGDLAGRLSTRQAHAAALLDLLSDEQHDEIVTQINAMIRAAHNLPQTGEAGGKRGAVPFDREHTRKATESNQWHSSTKPITKTDVSTGRESPVIRDTEGKDHTRTRPSRRKGA